MNQPLNSKRRGNGIDPIWYAPVLFVVVIALTALTAVLFSGAARSFERVTLVSDRAGLVMENGAKVKLRGVQIGEVESIGTEASAGDSAQSKLTLKIYPDDFRYLPSDVQAEIKSSTAFGAKYVDLIAPPGSSSKPLAPNAVLQSKNVTVEVNTVFQNLQSVVQSIDPAKLNSVLSAVADAVRGKGDTIGAAITASNDVLLAVNPLMNTTIKEDWQLFGKTAQAYSNAAQDIVSILDSFSTTSTTIANQSNDLNQVLLSSIGFAKSGFDTIGGNEPAIVQAMNLLAPTTELLNTYSPTYTCLFQGAQWFLEHGGRDALGGNGKSVIMDAALLAGDDPYRFPDNLPVVNAKGGPGGRPSCGSLPDVSKNFPVKYLVTDTGFGTGLDVRPNPGIGFPGLANYFPATKAFPEEPKIRYPGGPAPGPLPLYPGAPPYGAPEFAPDGTPLYPPAPGAPPPPPGPLPAPDPTSNGGQP
jgi:phospholipid/cholesterol/gamma-HCH transport system substrate-binding protein